MSTLLKSTHSLDPNPGTNASLGEKYGGENLPVLVQLPDLSALDAEAKPVTETVAAGAELNGAASEPPVEHDDRSSIRLADIDSEPEETADCPNDRAPSEVPERPAASPREQRLREQRQQRRERATRRSDRTAKTPVWLRGLSQLALAALLAGVLLAIVVTLKDWNAKSSADLERADGVPVVGAPTMDFAPVDTEPALGAPTTDGPSLGPPTFTDNAATLEHVLPGSPPVHAPDTHGRSQPASYGEPTSPANNLPTGQRTPGYTAGTSYPSTGDDRRVSNGWSETLRVSPVHSAERPAPPTYNQNNQHR